MKHKDKKPQNEDNSLKDSVLERLEETGIRPRSRGYWLFREYSMWALWSFSVLLGALSVAVIQFAGMHTSFALYEATHESFFNFALETLPSLWLLAFVSLGLVAYINLRHTKKGYKYSLSYVILSSVGFSLLGGVILNSVGIGFYLDTYAGRMTKMYESHEEMELRMWQDPSAGRLVGFYEEGEFLDINQGHWELNVMELQPRELDLLESGKKVRLVGMLDEEKEYFHTCGVFPWMLSKPPAFRELREERQVFIRDMKLRLDSSDNEKKEKVPKKDSLDKVCGEMPILERMGDR